MKICHQFVSPISLPSTQGYPCAQCATVDILRTARESANSVLRTSPHILFHLRPIMLSLKESLSLSPLGEGGYFAVKYVSAETCTTSEGNVRPTMSCIYFLLDKESPFNFMHLNKSDIVHFHHEGAPLTYITIDLQGKLHRTKLGSDVSRGETPQLLKLFLRDMTTVTPLWPMTKISASAFQTSMIRFRSISSIEQTTFEKYCGEQCCLSSIKFPPVRCNT